MSLRLMLSYSVGSSVFDLCDEDGNKVGEVHPNQSVNGVPSMDSFNRYQNAEIVLDGKAAKKLSRQQR